jgi:predicted transcriptional regulator
MNPYIYPGLEVRTQNLYRIGLRDISDVVEDVCYYFEIPKDVLKSKVRTAKVADARCIAIYLLRNVEEMRVTDIQAIFKLDHSTVIYNLNKFKTLYGIDQKFRKTFDLFSSGKYVIHEPKEPRKYTRKVININNGVIYDSVKQAAEQTKKNIKTIYNQVLFKRGKFRYVD